jgi:hypothetical protein
VKNAFDMTVAEMDRRVDAYARAGNFSASPVNGRALNPNKDFIEKQVPESEVTAIFSELGAAGKSFPPDSPRGLAAKGTRPALELAAKANPRWAEPHFKLAALETNPEAKIKELKAAAALEPRNTIYWQTLAEAQVSAEQFADALKSWSAAERAAPSEAERARLRQARVDMEDRRAAFEIAERKRLAEEQARDLQRVKDSAAAEVHAAEEAANARQGGLKAGTTVVPWWDDETGEKVSGTLQKVDCLNGGPLRLTVQKDGGGSAVLVIRDPAKLAVKGSNEAQFVCGAQKPARKIRLVYQRKPDAKLVTVGDVTMVEFP